MKDFLALNKISPLVNDVLKGKFALKSESSDPVGILVRSFKMHEYDPAASVLCVGRAGAGVNNIPLDKYAEKGIVVFNTPGANANAVKELCILGMLLCGRKVIPAISWTQGLTTDVAAQVEKGKGDFVGGEILGKTLAVYGLGAIGKMVAISAAALGMKVVGYNRTVPAELQKEMDSYGIRIETDLDKFCAECDYFSLHVPCNAETKGFINKDRLAKMRDGVNIINAARAELVNNDDIKAALASGKVNRYVTDFPVEDVLGVENIITIPHLGASTPEAEDNCAVMAGGQMVDFIEKGNIKNSVNFPDVRLACTGSKSRVVLLMNGACSAEKVAEKMASFGKVSGSAYAAGKTTSSAIFDFADSLDAKAIEAIGALDCVIKARLI